MENSNLSLDFSKVIQKQKDRIADLLFGEVLKETQIEQLIALVNSKEIEIQELKNKLQELEVEPVEVEQDNNEQK